MTSINHPRLRLLFLIIVFTLNVWVLQTSIDPKGKLFPTDEEISQNKYLFLKKINAGYFEFFEGNVVSPYTNICVIKLESVDFEEEAISNKLIDKLVKKISDVIENEDSMPEEEDQTENRVEGYFFLERKIAKLFTAEKSIVKNRDSVVEKACFCDFSADSFSRTNLEKYLTEYFPPKNLKVYDINIKDPAYLIEFKLKSSNKENLLYEVDLDFQITFDYEDQIKSLYSEDFLKSYELCTSAKKEQLKKNSEDLGKELKFDRDAHVPAFGFYFKRKASIQKNELYNSKHKHSLILGNEGSGGIAEENKEIISFDFSTTFDIQELPWESHEGCHEIEWNSAMCLSEDIQKIVKEVCENHFDCLLRN